MIKAVSTLSFKGARPAQEDFTLANSDRRIFAVADGFGGAGPGAAASQAACEAVKDFLVREAGDTDATLPFVLRSYFSLAGNVLFNALVHANRKLVTLNKGKSAAERGGASALACFMDGDLLALANVGCCSAWLVRNGRAAELVTPRSLARLSDPFYSEASADQAVPLMALGIAEDLEPEIVEYKVKPGDWLLLHTDGMGAEAREAIQAIQFEQLPPQEAVRRVEESLQNQQFTENAASLLVIF